MTMPIVLKHITAKLKNGQCFFSFVFLSGIFLHLALRQKCMTEKFMQSKQAWSMEKHSCMFTTCSRLAYGLDRLHFAFHHPFFCKSTQ